MDISKSKRCCVPGCENKSSQRHRFPIKDPEIFQEWLRAVNYPPFFEMTPHQVYNSHYVCHYHFDKIATVLGTKRGLKGTSVPTLFLPEPYFLDISDRFEVEIENDEVSNVVDTEHSYCIKTESLEDEDPNIYVVDTNNSTSPQSVATRDNVEDIELDDPPSTLVALQDHLLYSFKLNDEEDNSTEEIHKENIVIPRKPVDIKNVTKKASMYSCPTCSKKFIKYKDYEAHLIIHPPHMCEVCGRMFIKRTAFNSHKLTHNAPNSFICEVCGKGYKDYISLRYHQQIHNKVEPYICEVCTKMFRNKQLLHNHVKFVHDKMFKILCDHCGRLFRHITKLNNHVRLVHLKEKPYQCDICQKKFGRVDHLRLHRKKNWCFRQRDSGNQRTRQKRTKVIIDDNDALMPCKFCGKLVKDKVKLERHLHTHLNRHKCQFCPQTFVAKSRLSQHELTHQNKPLFFRCNICYRKFKTTDELNEHVATQIHRRQPRYSCDICGMKFHRRFILSQHTLTEHISVPVDQKLDRLVHDVLICVER